MAGLTFGGSRGSLFFLLVCPALSSGNPPEFGHRVGVGVLFLGRLMKLEGMGSGIDLWEQNLGVGQFSWQADHSPILSGVASTQAAEIGHRVGL